VTSTVKEPKNPLSEKCCLDANYIIDFHNWSIIPGAVDFACKSVIFIGRVFSTHVELVYASCRRTNSRLSSSLVQLVSDSLLACA
jgi:hypothetical protein